jgi:hypothetical protein
MKTWSFGLLAVVLILSAAALTASAAPLLIFDMQAYSYNGTGGNTVISNSGHTITLSTTGNVGKIVRFRVYADILDGDQSASAVDESIDPATISANNMGDTLSNYTPSLYVGNDGITMLKYTTLGAGSGVVGNLTGAISGGGAGGGIWDTYSSNGTQTNDLNGNGGKDIGSLGATDNIGPAENDIAAVGTNLANNPRLGGVGGAFYVETGASRNIVVTDNGDGTATESIIGNDPNVTGITVGGLHYTQFLLGTEAFTITTAVVGSGTITLLPETGDTGTKYQKYETDNVVHQELGNDANISENAITMNVVPEPATMALIGMGAMGLLGLRRRRSA